MFIYKRKLNDKIISQKFSDIEEAKKRAIKDWATKSAYPQYIADENGNQSLGHADLLKYLLDKTGIGNYNQ